MFSYFRGHLGISDWKFNIFHFSSFELTLMYKQSLSSDMFSICDNLRPYFMSYDDGLQSKVKAKGLSYKQSRLISKYLYLKSIQLKRL